VGDGVESHGKRRDRGIERRGGKFYVRYVDVDGVRRMKLARGVTTIGDARAVLAKIEERVTKGLVGIEERTEERRQRATLTLRALYEKFMTDYSPPRVKDLASYREQTRSAFSTRVLPTLGARPAVTLTNRDIERLRDSLLADTYAPGSVAWTMARLSKLYAWGNQQKLIDCPSPVAGVEYPAAAAALDYLRREEVTDLLAWVDEHSVELEARTMPQIRPMVWTALLTGLRKGELMGLRWVDVHLDALRIDVNRSYAGLPKSGKPRYLPMHPDLARVLRGWRTQQERAGAVVDTGLVFPVHYPAEGWTMGERRHTLGLRHWLKAAGCHVPKRRPWHLLRHTFASHFMMSGGNILTLQKLLGHGDLATTMIYAHLAPDFMAEEIARMTFQAKPATILALQG
jgi:integrase